MSAAQPSLGLRQLGRALALLGLLWAAPLHAGTPAPALAGPPPLPSQLTLPVAIRFALTYNPELAAVRQQHGIAAGAVVTAQTYPFNPSWEDRITAANGPASAGITNRVSLDETLLLEVEVRGQGAYRRQQALAALTRTDWEIAAQEQAVAVSVIRAFDTILYRQAKLDLLNETVQLDELLLRQVEELFQAGRARAADRITARTELAAARSLIGPGRTTLTVAQADLSKALGVVDGVFTLQGALEPTAPEVDPARATRAALERRPDLRARQAAEREAEANLRLSVANRFGNPVVGPAFSYNETAVYFIGAQVNVPLPVFNRLQGEIQQRQAERAQAVLEVRQVETAVRQDVQAALTRLGRARAAVDVYRERILPSLETDVTAIKRLYTSGEPGVGVLEVIDVQRKLLQARDGYIDALYELSQAEADLAAAVGDPAVVLPPCPPAGAAPQAQVPGAETLPAPREQAPTDLPTMPTITVPPHPGPR